MLGTSIFWTATMNFFVLLLGAVAAVLVWVSGAVAGGQCDRSYPNVCIPPAPPNLSCKDVAATNFKVLPPDPHGFDRDKDGVGCEPRS
jgi:hypothetical protein